MFVSNMWAMPFEDGFAYCEYGALRAPPIQFPPLTELPDMAETSIILTNGPSTNHLHHQHHHLNNNSLNSGTPNGSMVQDGTNTATSTILTVRMIMQGKEVGSIIGKKGDNIKKFREDSGAKINISDGSCPERIVTITGSTDNIHRAFGFICKKFEEDLQNTPTTPKPPVTLRLVVPASQCGSLIGKQGCKIKEIRESTGASIQVASEMLPNSTERAVTVSGTADAITQCIKYVCGIMLESPPKGANLPYRPKPLLSPVYISGSQGFTVPASLPSLPGQDVCMLPKGFHHPVQMAHAIPMVSSAQHVLPGSLVPVNGLGPAALPHMWPGPLPQPQPPPCLSLGPSLQYTPRAGNPAPQQAITNLSQQAQEMNIPNDLIGCIIGRGGQKINEIRQVSGANIKISNAEDGSSDRKVTITGSPECIGLAQYLISTSMELHKTLTLDPASLPPVSSMAGPLPQLPPHPMAMTVVKSLPPPSMLGLNSMASLNGMGQLVDPASIGAQGPPSSISLACSLPTPSAMTGGKPLQTKMRVGLTATSAFKAAERPKFSPY
nr:poly(rC)-binding protein 3-like [Biomphalaria glabrata]